LGEAATLRDEGSHEFECGSKDGGTNLNAGLSGSQCGQKVQMVTAEDAARTAKVTARTIYRRTESGQLHFIESQEGILLICTRSLRDG